MRREPCAVRLYIMSPPHTLHPIPYTLNLKPLESEHPVSSLSFFHLFNDFLQYHAGLFPDQRIAHLVAGSFRQIDYG